MPLWIWRLKRIGYLRDAFGGRERGLKAVKEFLEGLGEVLATKWFQAILYLLAGLIAIRIISLVVGRVEKHRKKSVQTSFIKGILQALVVLIVGLRIMALSNVLAGFMSTILMSSSLIVVVLGFIFQEGLSNIVHGFIITLFHPFEVGDRVEVVVGSEKITGYVRAMTLRHTVVCNIVDNAECIIPNSVLDSSMIRNLTSSQGNRYPVVVNITYEDAQKPEKIKMAKELISEAILEHRKTIDTRKDPTKPLFVNVAYQDSSVALTCFVTTKTAEDNYLACSEIREALLAKFAEHEIGFAYNHLELTGTVGFYGTDPED